MIIVLALISFIVLLFGLHLLLKDFSLFIWRKTTSISLPKTFVDFGEYAVTVFFVIAISLLGLLFYKFATAFFAYILSRDIISFFVTLRGVFSIENDIQSPFSFHHIISGLLTPALQFITFYFIYRGIRTFMFSINRYYEHPPYSESDVLYFGFLSSLSFILFEIIFYSQNIPTISGVAHLTYLAVSKLSAIGYYLAIAHIQLLKNEQYKNSLPTYVHLRKREASVVFSPLKITILTYIIGVILYAPFYSGTQFLQNNLLLICIYLVSCTLFYLTLRFFLSGGFNYLGVIMLAEGKGHLLPNTKLFEAKTEMKILIAAVVIAILFAVFRFKLFFVIILFFIATIAIYILLHLFFYFLGLSISFLRIKLNKQLLPEINTVSVPKYLLTTVKASAKATTPMLGFIFFVFALLSFFPKHFNYQNENYVHSVFDNNGSALYVEHTDKNGCIPISYSEIPKFFFKCLYLQEDRSFTKQNSLLPQKSNWHGISLATFYRIFSGGGGSNINMQLIKNVAFPKSFPQDVQRKFSESMAAYQLSLQCSDTVIVTDYLNEISMNGGQGQSGTMEASLNTFGIPISELNPLEIMYLVSTLKRGAQFQTKEGYINYQDAANHTDAVMEVLLAQAKLWHEKGLLTNQEFNALHNQELRFINKPYHAMCEITTKEFLIRQIKESEIKGMTYKSSISLSNQQHISNAVKKFNTTFQNLRRVEGCDLYTAALVIDVKTGEVKAHYGGEGVTDLTQFAGGSPVGSIIKPFVLLEMLESGFKFDDILLYDGQIKGKLTPNNYSKHYSNRFVGVNEILGRSLNAPMVNIRQVTDALALYKSVEGRFTAMGISKDIFLNLDDLTRKSENEINYPLGSRNMTLFEIAQAYQTLFNRGKYFELSVFSSTFDPSKNTIQDLNQKQRQVYSQANAEMIATALNNATKAGGTGVHIKELLPKNRTYFIKTGTTDGAKHGYTVLSDGNTLIVTYASYGKTINGRLELNDVPPIPHNSGGASAGVLAAYIYNEIN